jgi:phenylpropionate dioxygenase-like ring-hydroxylating dioxygenase large terminal subunit
VTSREDVSPLALPTSRYPTGWFQIAWCDEVRPGDLKLLRYFGEDIILWRGEDGELHAQDAYCLHLGGNIGVRGKVIGNEVQCPWHGWQWAGDGSNTHIPHSSLSCKKTLKLRTYPLVEWYGAVMVWHDLLGGEPQWDLDPIPDMDTDEFFPMLASCRMVNRIKAHPQLPLENSCDLFHVTFVHGGDVGDVMSIDFDGPYATEHLGLVYGSKNPDGTWLTPDGQPKKAVVVARMGGIGNTWLRFPDDLIAAVQFANVTPVDEEYSDYWVGMTTRRPDKAATEPDRAGRRMIDLQMKVVEQDFFTWENMKTLAAPNFAPEEAKNYSALRRWSRQFYPDLAGQLLDVVAAAD